MRTEDEEEEKEKEEDREEEEWWRESGRGAPLDRRTRKKK